VLGALRVIFSRDAGRWSHSLGLEGERPLLLAATLESDAERDPPGQLPSPVYQELLEHEPGGNPWRLLLTGCVFDHHFSAVATHGREPGPDAAWLLDFDLADRCRSPISYLAATYTLALDSSAIIEAGSARLVLGSETMGPVELALEAQPPAVLTLGEAGRRMMRVQIAVPAAAGVFTHRLRYRFRWAIARAASS